MLQLWVIALLGAVYLEDHLTGPGGVLRERHTADHIDPRAILLTLVPYLAIALVTDLVCRNSARRMDQTGSRRAIFAAERMLVGSRVAAVVTHAAAVFTLGWVQQVRAVVGNWIMLDELVAIAPPLFAIGAGWWSYYPIDRRIREATIMRGLDDGRPAYPIPSRWQFVWSSIRHQVLFILVPLALIGAWTESWERIVRSLMARQFEPTLAGRIGATLAHSAWAEVIEYAGQLAGVAAVFLLSPAIMRWVWDAVPLGTGPLRDRLLTICSRAGVRVRELLVWRTHGTMLNGAAMGLVGRLRYILLTDALLDHLPERQVESVMAHEVGHAKHHHIPWLVLGMLASMTIVGTLVTAAVSALVFAAQLMPVRTVRPVTIDLWLQGPGSVVIVLAGFAMFGWISRRFEWQADAFAAKQLSKDDPAAQAVTPEAAEAMCDALQAVADLNNIPAERPSFRHGSILHRQQRLRRLIGVPLARLPIDRTVWLVKGGIALGLLIAFSLFAGAAVFQSSARPREPDPFFLPRDDAPAYYPDIRVEGWPQSRVEQAP